MHIDECVVLMHGCVFPCSDVVDRLYHHINGFKDTFLYQYPHPYTTQPPSYHELSTYNYTPSNTGSQHYEGELEPWIETNSGWQFVLIW